MYGDLKSLRSLETLKLVADESPTAHLRIKLDESSGRPLIIGANKAARLHLTSGIFCRLETNGGLWLIFLDKNGQPVDRTSAAKRLSFFAAQCKLNQLGSAVIFPLVDNSDFGSPVFASIRLRQPLEKDHFLLAIYAHHGVVNDRQISLLETLDWPGHDEHGPQRLDRSTAEQLLTYSKFKLCGLHAVQQFIEEECAGKLQLSVKRNNQEDVPRNIVRAGRSIRNQAADEKAKENKRLYHLTLGEETTALDLERLIQIVSMAALENDLVGKDRDYFKRKFEYSRETWRRAIGAKMTEAELVDTCMRFTAI